MTDQPGNSDFIPLILAADINAYSWARAFHEQYGIVSAGLGRSLLGPVRDSRIIQFKAVTKLDQAEVLIGQINDFAQRYPNQRILLVSCSGYYTSLVYTARESLSKNLVVAEMAADTLYRLTNKQLLYTLCEERGIDIPESFIYQESFGGRLELTFPAPYIVKPSDTLSWWANPFNGQRKAHLVSDKTALKNLISQIYAHGYAGSLLIQEYIEGADTQLFKLTLYLDNQGKLGLSHAGQILLADNSASSEGNPAIQQSVDLADPAQYKLSQATEQAYKLLFDLGYRGFASISYKFDAKKQCLRLLGLNDHPDRANYAITASGQNIARIMAEDLLNGGLSDANAAYQEVLWHITPLALVPSVVDAAGLSVGLADLLRQGRTVDPLDYPADRGLARRFWLNRYHEYLRQKYQHLLQGGAHD